MLYTDFDSPVSASAHPSNRSQAPIRGLGVFARRVGEHLPHAGLYLLAASAEQGHAAPAFVLALPGGGTKGTARAPFPRLGALDRQCFAPYVIGFGIESGELRYARLGPARSRRWRRGKLCACYAGGCQPSLAPQLLAPPRVE